ncbi:actin binding Rho activating protein b [Brachyhypopomus gauderio]|uniref:actin binding Rho activating protein b n=1 Tax=Brachyhypopomus gauderio TaxID=698409 RepID=UPI0040434C82
MSAKTSATVPTKPTKKLHTLSTVCGLARSWQQWVCENEERQATEPSGWSPDSDNKAKTKAPTKPPPSEKKPRTSPAPKPQHQEEEPGETRIKTKQVTKTVTRDVQEKSVGIEFLSSRICKDAAMEEVDKILLKKSSPTLRRKCSNMVSELTRSWKAVESEQKKTEEATEDKDLCEAQEILLELDTHGKDPEPKDKETKSSPPSIKRPSNPGAKREAQDAEKINALSHVYSTVDRMKNRWQDWASEHTTNQKLNPFSDDFDYNFSMSTRLRKGDEGYGRPKEGSKTAERARRAEAHIQREIDQMCFIIQTMADPDPDGRTRVSFGQLFDRYVRISDKVVGILMRARKHGKVSFQGEMLWQGRDDDVIVTLLV